jgi:hypothetical protein
MTLHLDTHFITDPHVADPHVAPAGFESEPGDRTVSDTTGHETLFGGAGNNTIYATPTSPI